MDDVDDDQSHRKKGNGDSPDRGSEHLFTHKHYRYYKLNLWLVQNLMMYQMRTLQLYILHHHQLDLHQQHREVAPQKTKNLGRKGEHFHVHLLKDVNGSSATVDPQNSCDRPLEVTTRTRRPTKTRSTPTKEMKTVAAKQPCEPSKAKKHKSMQMKTMKNLEIHLQPLQMLNLLHQHFIKILVMKTVSSATNTVHTVRILEGHYSSQIFTP